MLRAMNEVCTTMALADDLVSVCYGEYELFKLLKTLERCCKERSFIVNKKKSAILEIRIDKKQKPRTGSLEGYPLVQSYKYLGVQIDDCLKFDVDIKERQKKQRNLDKQLWIIRSQKLSGKGQLQIWHSLHRAKWSYGAEVLTGVSKDFKEWLKRTWYRALKQLLGLTGTPNREKLFLSCFGNSWEAYMSFKHKSVLKRLGIDCPAHYCGKACTDDHDRMDNIPVITALKNNAPNIIKLKNNRLLTGWSKQESTVYDGIRAITTKKFQKVYCQCNHTPQS